MNRQAHGTGIALPGIGGTLFPRRYLEAGLPADLDGAEGADSATALRRRLLGWWSSINATCGPATGLRALFDLFTAPLFGMLGFRARHVEFDAARVRARLETPRGTRLGLLMLPWCGHPPGVWADVIRVARDAGADWCFLAAPPHLSIVDARGRATRASLDFTLPQALAVESVWRLWLLGRAAAFDPVCPASRGNDQSLPILEALVARASRFQDAVCGDLQSGVAEALGALLPVVRSAGAGAGVTRFDESLTVVYRILFLLFAESRALVPQTHPVYARSYAVAALCREALESASLAPPPAGLWDGLAAITRLSRAGCRMDDLIVSPFNGRLFDRAAAPSLESRTRGSRRTTTPRDAAMRRALLALGSRPGRAGRESIAYADLDVEQLGAVYERVLDLDPLALPGLGEPSQPAPRPPHRHSARRKQSGTFYTPQPLAEFLVRRTLEPLVEARTSDEILALRVLDPAMGSGAFLVAACRFLADACEQALVDEGRLHAVDVDETTRAGIRRMVAERCLAGVDINPVAVQLARLSLWLTTLARDKPLSFLDHRLRVGNSLVGASPADLWRTPLRPARARSRATPVPSLFDDGGLPESLRLISRPLRALLDRRDDSVVDVREKERLWQQIRDDRSPLAPWRRACDLWCAQWLWPSGDAFGSRPSSSEIRAAIAAVTGHDETLPPGDLRRLSSAAQVAADEHRLFHWPLEFPDVFYTFDGAPCDRPGFDAVVGNPPWEMLRHDGDGPADAAPSRNALMAFLRTSGLYANCGQGHLNLYQAFLERSLSLVRTGGRAGLIVPWGLASDSGTAALRASLLDRHGLDTIVGLDNGHGLFPIHRGLRFMVVVARVGEAARAIRGRFGVSRVDELLGLPGRDDPEHTAFPVRLTPEVIDQVGGVERRFPDARRPGDLALAVRLKQRFPSLGRRDGWQTRFGRELNATDDRALFGPRGLPVLEGKHVAPFVVDTVSTSRRISQAAAERALGPDRFGSPRLAYRDVSAAGNRLSLIAAVMPAGVVTTHTLFCLRQPVLPVEQQHLLCALFNSYVLNAIVRLLMGQHVTTTLVEDLPAPTWTGAPEQRAIAAAAERLSRGQGLPGDEAHLQAAVARLYGLTREELADLVEGFPLIPEADRRAAVEGL